MHLSVRVWENCAFLVGRSFNYKIMLWLCNFLHVYWLKTILKRISQDGKTLIEGEKIKILNPTCLRNATKFLKIMNWSIPLIDIISTVGFSCKIPILVVSSKGKVSLTNICWRTLLSRWGPPPLEGQELVWMGGCYFYQTRQLITLISVAKAIIVTLASLAAAFQLCALIYACSILNKRRLQAADHN